MSSHPSSRDYYHTSGSRVRSNSQILPPIRSVLGDELDLPVNPVSRGSPYDLGDISRALPPSSGAQDYRTSARSASRMSGSYAETRSYHYEAPQSQRPHTYPQSSSTVASRHARPTTSSHDSYRHSPNSSRDFEYSSASHASDRGTQKKYACTWEGCDKRFERQHALDTHMNIHLDQKPFPCPIPYCGKEFNVRSNMRRHLLTHKEYQEADGGQDPYGEESYDPHGRHLQASSRTHQGAAHSAETHYASSSSQYYSSSRRK